MKILVVTPPCHFKNAGAAQRDIYNTIRMLKKLGHTVSMFTVDSPAQDSETLRIVGDQEGIEVLKFLPPSSKGARLKSIIKDWPLFDGAAYVFDALVKSEQFINYIKGWKPERIVSFCSYSWPVIKFTNELGIYTILRSHNFESDFFWEALDQKEKINPLNWLRYLAKGAGEKRSIKYSSKVATLPFDGVKYYRKWKKQGVVDFTLTFLPESLRPPQVHPEKQVIDTFYLGASYNVIFHLRGVEKLIEQIAPQVLKQAPGKFRFHICGGKLPERLVKKCDGENIIYEGYVPDLDEFLDKMDAGVFPVQTGKTMKGKVFDTLARAFPMVIPENCLGGYDLKSGEEVLLADSIEENVAQILKLQDLETRKKIATGAYNFSQKNFSEESMLKLLAEILSN